MEQKERQHHQRCDSNDKLKRQIRDQDVMNPEDFNLNSDNEWLDCDEMVDDETKMGKGRKNNQLNKSQPI